MAEKLYEIYITPRNSPLLFGELFFHSMDKTRFIGRIKSEIQKLTAPCYFTLIVSGSSSGGMEYFYGEDETSDYIVPRSRQNDLDARIHLKNVASDSYFGRLSDTLFYQPKRNFKKLMNDLNPFEQMKKFDD